MPKIGRHSHAPDDHHRGGTVCLAEGRARQEPGRHACLGLELLQQADQTVAPRGQCGQTAARLCASSAATCALLRVHHSHRLAAGHNEARREHADGHLKCASFVHNAAQTCSSQTAAVRQTQQTTTPPRAGAHNDTRRVVQSRAARHACEWRSQLPPSATTRCSTSHVQFACETPTCTHAW